MCLKEDRHNKGKEWLFWENNGKLIKRRRNGVLYDRFFKFSKRRLALDDDEEEEEDFW